MRSGELTVRTAYDSYRFTVTQNGVIIELEENPDSDLIEFEMGDTANEKIVKIRSNKEWKVKVPQEYAGWLSAEKTADGELKITVGDNNTLQPLSGEIVLTTVDIIDGFDGVTFRVVNPNLKFDITSGCNLGYDEATGATRIKIQNGELIQVPHQEGTHHNRVCSHLRFRYCQVRNGIHEPDILSQLQAASRKWYILVPLCRWLRLDCANQEDRG